MPQTRVIAVANHKGGVGKTHSAYHLSGVYAERGQRVLVIDLDLQGNLTKLFATQPPTTTLWHVLIDDIPLADAVQHTAFDHIDFVPADEKLGEDLAIALRERDDAEVRLADAIDELGTGTYSVLILDCPPSIGLVTKNALAAAHQVVVPLEADRFSVEGLRTFRNLIERTRKSINPNLELAGILLSLFNGRRAIERLFEEQIRATGLPVFSTPIKNSVNYREAITKGKPITHYRPRSEHADAFRRLADELTHVYAH